MKIDQKIKRVLRLQAIQRNAKMNNQDAVAAWAFEEIEKTVGKKFVEEYYEDRRQQEFGGVKDLT